MSKHGVLKDAVAEAEGETTEVFMRHLNALAAYEHGAAALIERVVGQVQKICDGCEWHGSCEGCTTAELVKEIDAL